MGMVDWAIIGAGFILYLLLLWRCQSERHWSHYPLFSIYLVLSFLRTAAITFLRHLDPLLYVLIYWSSDLLIVILRFCVAWEVLRKIFPPRTTLREITVRILIVLLTVLAFGFYFLDEPQGSIFLDLERKAGLAVVFWLATVLLLARFYNLALSRNIWGMAVGMGLYVSISIANFSAVDLQRSLESFWRRLTPLSFLAMLLIWLWALWTYTPPPLLLPVSGPSLDAAQAGWQRSWRELIATIRKGQGR